MSITSKLLKTGLIAGLLTGVYYCSKHVHECTMYKGSYLTGTVIKEGGSVADSVKHLVKGYDIWGGEILKVEDPTYILTVNTNEGLYFINLNSSFSNNAYKTIETLCEAIKPGDKVVFPKYISNKLGNVQNYFSDDHIGNLDTNQIEVIKKK